MNNFLDMTSAGWALLPACQPETELFPGTSIVVGQFSLSPGQRAVAQLFLHFVGSSTLGGLEKVSIGLPTVYAGVYLNFPVTQNVLPAPPAVFIGRDLPGVSTYVMDLAEEISTPGQYSIVLANNSASAANQALLTGVILIKNLYAPA